MKIMKSTNENLNKNMMACEPCDDGLCKVEIDESKIIKYDGKVRRMLGIADRGRFDVRIFLLMIIGPMKLFYLLLKDMFILIQMLL